MLSPQESKKQADVVRHELVQMGITRSVEVTCEKCEANDDCEFAFDGYNTDGDCLMLK